MSNSLRDYVRVPSLSSDRLDLSLQIAPEIAEISELGTEEDWQIIFSQWQALLCKEYDLTEITLPWELTLKFTSDREIQSLNQQFRQIDRATDVLAFASLEVDMPLIPDQPTYLGDIVISVETADRQAKAQGWQIYQEMLWLASHGLLHLLGWDHPDEDSLQIMWDIQELLMDSLISARE